MTELETIEQMAKRFDKEFPKSHLIISYDFSTGKGSTDRKWILSINFDELIDDYLNPTKIYEEFENNDFKELTHRLDWHMFRYANTVKGIMEEINEKETGMNEIFEDMNKGFTVWQKFTGDLKDENIK